VSALHERLLYRQASKLTQLRKDFYLVAGTSVCGRVGDGLLLRQSGGGVGFLTPRTSGCY